MIRKFFGYQSQNHRVLLDWFSYKRKRLQHNLIELILWVLLVCLAFFIYLPQISSFSASLFSLSKQQSSISNQWPGLELTVQLIVQDGANGSFSTVLANHTSNTPYIVPREYREIFDYDLSEEFMNVQPGHPVDTFSKEFTRIVIKCRAPFAIELAYKGPAVPRFGRVTVEKQRTHTTQSFYELILHFDKNELQEMDTGRYICKATENHLLSTLGDRKTNGFIDIFVPGEMKLLHNGLQNDHGLLGRAAVSTPIIVYYDVGRGGKEITLPCGVSHPQTKVSLYHKGSNLALENKAGIVFDALEGFRVPFKLIENLLLANPDHHQFACRSKGGIEELLFNIAIKDARKSHVSPSSSLVVVGQGQLPVQMFVCEAEEPVMISWLDGPPAVTLKETTKNESYKLSFIATPTHYNNTKGSMSRIQCSRKRDGMIIHVWEWVGNGVAKPFLRYNRKRKELSCCMNPAHAPPQLVVITCSTMLECQVKGSFQPKIAPGGSNGVSNNVTGCNVWTVPDSFHGVILCNQVNSNPFRDPSLYKEFPPVFFKWNDDVVAISKNISSKPLKDLITMRLLNDTLETTPDHHQIKVECLASTFVFAKGLRWTMHTQSGQVFTDLQFKSSWATDALIFYQEEYSMKDATIRGTLLLSSASRVARPNLSTKEYKGTFVNLSKSQFLDKIVSITCEAPLWNSTNAWINSTLTTNI